MEEKNLDEDLDKLQSNMCFWICAPLHLHQGICPLDQRNQLYFPECTIFKQAGGTVSERKKRWLMDLD